MTQKRPRASIKLSRRGRQGSFQYDVCLSFAGEDRAYVERVARALTELGVRVFYDKHEEVTLWGKNLYDHLDYVYRKAARFCVLFVSRHYASRIWTNHELQSIQARVLRENKEYVLPARFDATEIPGLRETIGYLTLRGRSPRQLATLICNKIGPKQRFDFLPPTPDRLHGRIGVRTAAQKREVDAQLQSFYDSWQKMDRAEREVIVDLISHSCAAGLPKDFHMNVDLLRRITGLPITRLEEILGNLSSLEFLVKFKKSKSKQPAEQRTVELVFNSLSAFVEDPGPHNLLVQAVWEEMGQELCPACVREQLVRSDFSQLSSSTMEDERHVRRRHLRESKVAKSSWLPRH
jgi:hypothetical protein